MISKQYRTDAQEIQRMQKSEYRPDIDGLRTIAVMSVLIFHAGFTSFSGGFVGVDVFFVISGYLITRIIKSEVEHTGHFSFSNFYARRIKRLLPALLFTLLASLVLGFFLFSPQHLERLGESTIAALFSVSNFFFWSESGYFDTASDLKPLLHTWSLSVEEQFYLIWPLLILLSVRYLGKYAPWSIAVLGALSLMGAVKMLDHDASGAYFLTPVRAYEFAIGAITVWVAQYRLRSNLLMELLLISGLSMVLLPVFIFDENTAFPGIAAVLPCLGTAMAIYSGQARFTGVILRNPVSVKIGLISYSLYLAHWPIIVFYKYYIFRDLFMMEKLGIILASLLVGWGMYKFIETPFRKARGPGSSKRNVFASYGCAALALTVPSVFIFANDGLEWRIPLEIRSAVSNLNKKRNETWMYISKDGAIGSTSFSDPNKKNIAIVGDSHSKDIYNAFYLSGYLSDDYEFRRVEMRPICLYKLTGKEKPSALSGEKERECGEQADHYFSNPIIKNADHIILSARWYAHTIRYVTPYIEILKEKSDANIILMGRAAEFKSVPDLTINFGRLAGLENFLYKNRDLTLDTVNKQLSNIAEDSNVYYIDKTQLSCLMDDGKCFALDDGKNLLYYDYGHYTLEGALFFGNRMKELGLFSKIL